MSDTYQTETGRTRRDLAWPTEPTFFLTIDYECDYGTALEENTYEALQHTEEFVDLIERFDVPLTCFIQTEVLDEAPEEVERLRNASVPLAFHPHSHTHKPRERTDIEGELRRSLEVYREFFGHSPSGYRFPNGNIRSQDYQLLTEYGFKFDASVFPSWRPGHFDNTSAPTNPQYLPEYDLFEIPFTVYSNRLRVPTALSYCRLIGRPYTELLCRRPPTTVIFNIHMHDLVNSPSFDDLSKFYQGIYSRNTNGLKILASVLKRFEAHEYEFSRIDYLHNSLRA